MDQLQRLEAFLMDSLVAECPNCHGMVSMESKHGRTERCRDCFHGEVMACDLGLNESILDTVIESVSEWQRKTLTVYLSFPGTDVSDGGMTVTYKDRGRVFVRQAIEFHKTVVTIGSFLRMSILDWEIAGYDIMSIIAVRFGVRPRLAEAA